ncbi:MAG: hypothetical protein HYZ28_08370 [Myxococcales bacterium]|nr:hypothetical protein [Myxococcales bacterium]
MSPLHLVAGISIVFAVLFLHGLLQRRPDPALSLRARYLALTRLSPAEARAHLAGRLESLSERFPGHSYVWYLSWLVKDLERSKQ